MFRAREFLSWSQVSPQCSRSKQVEHLVRRRSKAWNKGMMGIKGEKVKVKSEFIRFQNGWQEQQEPRRFPQSCWSSRRLRSTNHAITVKLQNQSIAIPAQHPAHILFMSDTWTRIYLRAKSVSDLMWEEEAAAVAECLKISSPKELSPLFLFTLH